MEAVLYSTYEKLEDGPAFFSFWKLRELITDTTVSPENLNKFMEIEINKMKKEKEYVSQFCTGFNATLELGAIRFDMLVAGNIDEYRAFVIIYYNNNKLYMNFNYFFFLIGTFLQAWYSFNKVYFWKIILRLESQNFKLD